MSDKAQRTEPASPRRIEKARKEGQFPSAKEFVSAIQFLAFVAIVANWGGEWILQTKRATRLILERAFERDVTAPELVRLVADSVSRVVFPLLLAGSLLIVLTVTVQLLATNMGFSLKKLTPGFKRLNPIAKLRELPRQNIPMLVKALIMLPFFIGVVYAIAQDSFPAYFLLPLQDVETGALRIAMSILDLLWKAATMFMVFGCIDLMRQRHRYQKDLRMSKQELRDEAKESEGNPQVKMRIRRLRRDLLRRRMVQEVSTATALIVNPTHYAVAIRYQFESMAAPVVVAKGKNYLAQRIRQRAIAHQIPIVENPPLAQALYKSVDTGQEIPAHLYRAVAEILGYIYRLMNGKMPG